MRVKICGVTKLDNARMVVAAGADMLGLNFYKPSPRHIELDAARELCDALRAEYGKSCPVLVGVFANAVVSDIAYITNHVGLDFAQLSGDETADVLKELRGIGYKAIRPMNADLAADDVAYFREQMPQNERAPSILLDAYHPKLYGGTGEEANIEVANLVKAQVPRMMLAGGLEPENVAERVRAIQPWGVDVASGVEGSTPGIKDEARVKAFIARAREAANDV